MKSSISSVFGFRGFGVSVTCEGRTKLYKLIN